MSKNTNIYTYKDNTNTFNIVTDINEWLKAKFINTVTNLVVNEDYYPSLRNLFFDFELINYFTDVDVTEIEKSETSIQDMEDFLKETDIVEYVKDILGEELIETLNKYVDESIEYRTGIHKNPLLESLGSLLKTAEKQMSALNTDKTMDLINKLGNISGDLTPEKIFETYMNSDVFKKIHSNNSKNKGTKKSKNNINPALKVVTTPLPTPKA